MFGAIRRWRDEVGDTHVLGLVRIALGLILFANALRAARELQQGYFGDVFHWPILPEALVASRTAYAILVAVQMLLAALVVSGHRARPALFLSALAGVYLLLCDRVQFHHNRAALFFYSLLLSFSPCDRSLSMAVTLAGAAGPLWAARLAQVQVSLVYIASGGSKLFDADWRTGRVLMERAALYGHQAVERGIPAGLVRWIAEAEAASTLAKMAIATELLLAVGVWLGPARVFALWWGLWFHLTIEATSRVESFTWLTLALYALFCVPDVRGRKLYYDASRLRGRILARTVSLLDWLARFEVKAWAPDHVVRGHAVVVIRRDGSHATGLGAVAMVARCTPLVFPLWAPLALVASFTKGGDTTSRA
jgi:HTTM domain